MRNLISASLLTALLGVNTWSAAPAIEPPPPFGPGAIAIAVKDLCAAADRRDGDYLRTALTEFDKSDGLALTFDAAGKMVTIDDAKARLAFVDVDQAGNVVTATDLDGALQAMQSKLFAKSATVQTRILSVQANCPSRDCSWAAVELQRTVTIDGKTTVQPLHATALARFTGGTPSMQIYCWHCSATAAPASDKNH